MRTSQTQGARLALSLLLIPIVSVRVGAAEREPEKPRSIRLDPGTPVELELLLHLNSKDGPSGSTVHLEVTAPGSALGAGGVDKGGFYISAALSGSELNAPKQTPGADLGLFRGLGLAPAFGYRMGRFRLEAEVHLHSSTALFHSDTVGLRAILANGYLDIELPKRFAVFLGAGVGRARVHVDFSTCLDEAGCPFFPDTDTTDSAGAYQYMFGVGWSPYPRHQAFVAYRRFYSRDLGLVDQAGAPFAENHVDMPMSLIGYRWDF